LTIADHDRNSEAMARAAVELRAKLAQVLGHTGRHEEARKMMHEAIGLADGHGSFQRARLHNILGQLEQVNRRLAAAQAAYSAAEELLGSHPAEQDQATVDLWLDIQLAGLAQVHYWQDQAGRVLAVLARARPVVEARGGPAQKQAFYQALVIGQLTERRHRVDNEILANAVVALAAAKESGGLLVIGGRVFELGWCLLFYGDLSGAEERLTEALGIAERMGETGLRMMSLCYLTVNALRRHDTGAVAYLAPQAIEAANAEDRPEYAAMGTASLAWLAWREGRIADVEPRAEEALESWTTAVWHPFHWICLWPLIAVHLGRSRTAEAIDFSRQLLVAPQQRLPDALESAVQTAIAGWDSGEAQLAAQRLGDALELAQRLRYA
jgi:tetratricopeptide (TPR) repeat protein